MLYYYLSICAFILVTIFIVIKNKKINIIFTLILFIAVLSVLIYFSYKLVPYNIKGPQININQIFLFLTMCLGMISNSVYTSIRNRKFKIHLFELVKPLFVSPIVFLFVWGIIQKMEETDIITYFFSFQNGFFWRIIFDNAKNSVSRNAQQPVAESTPHP